MNCVRGWLVEGVGLSESTTSLTLYHQRRRWRQTTKIMMIITIMMMTHSVPAHSSWAFTLAPLLMSSSVTSLVIPMLEDLCITITAPDPRANTFPYTPLNEVIFPLVPNLSESDGRCKGSTFCQWNTFCLLLVLVFLFGKPVNVTVIQSRNCLMCLYWALILW